MKKDKKKKKKRLKETAQIHSLSRSQTSLLQYQQYQ